MNYTFTNTTFSQCHPQHSCTFTDIQTIINLVSVLFQHSDDNIESIISNQKQYI